MFHYFDGVLIKDFEINIIRMEVTCTNCNHTTQLDVNFDVKIYACTNCVYVYQERDGLRFKDQLRPLHFRSITSGSSRCFNNTDYTITGFWSKRKWKDLNGRKSKKFLYLSEADGLDHS
jgi:hypothetical protein